MKNLSLALNIILLLAVSILFYWHFQLESCTADKKVASVVTNSISTEVKPLKIVYVNTDSLWGKYQYIVDMQTKLAEEKLKLEGRYTYELKKLEKEYMEVREQVKYMTQEQAQQKEVEMNEKQQKLMKLEQDLNIRWQQTEQDKNLELQEKIKEHLAQYSKEHDCDLILSYSSIGNLLFATPKMDITNSVVANLNTQYKATQKIK